jgi:hypothetical protein
MGYSEMHVPLAQLGVPKENNNHERTGKDYAGNKQQSGIAYRMAVVRYPTRSAVSFNDP